MQNIIADSKFTRLKGRKPNTLKPWLPEGERNKVCIQGYIVYSRCK